MSAKIKALLPALREETELAREKFANQAFDLELVRVSLMKAAARGQKSLRIRLPDNLAGMNGTAAGKALTAYCAREGLHLTWEKRSAELTDEGRRVDLVEPEFSW
ncbi:hypothetical protein [Nitrobacter sp. JJSN]|uniref:hypothetical protein n=1 Tax=Nitrobacter sp. JJSN TaxID=3453033 RepID=UPI003F75C119